MAMAPAFWSSSSPKPPERTTIAGIPAFFAASTSHTESPIITLDASGGVPSFPRHLQQVRCRLGRLDVGATAGAGQHEPVTTFLDGYEQVAGTGQRRYLLEQRVDLLALLLPGLISHPVLQVLASDSREHLVPAHADQPIHRIGLAHRAQCPVPVNVEDGDGEVSHGRPLPAIPNRTVSELLCLVPRSRARTSRCGRRRPARTGDGRPDVAFSPR